MEQRVRLLGGLFLITSMILIGRLFFWQVVQGEELRNSAQYQRFSTDRITATRGNILASDGTWLAASVEKWLLYASPPDVEDSNSVVANSVAPIVVSEDVDKEEVMEEVLYLQEMLSRDNLLWVPLAKNLNKEQKSNIEALDIPGLGFEATDGRYYPEASSSAHLMGFVGKDDEGGDKGYFGLEGFYNLTLTGKPGFARQESDAAGNPLVFGSSKKVPEKKGIDLLTHIDKTVQLTIEENLKRGIEKYGASAGSIIVMDPSNGAVLGMDSYPSYDPINYFEYGDSLFRNPVISDTYEPGSIFKPVVMAAGLDAEVITPDTECDICDRPYKVDKYFIKTWDNEYHPNATMTEVIKNSDNVGMAFIGQKLGADKLYDYLESFGFGSLTGVDLQGEVALSLREKGTWNVVDLATTTFGQGIAVTPIQMIKAIAIIANDGVPVTPQVVDEFQTQDWSEDLEPEFGNQVISRKAANQITEMMVSAVSLGEAKWAVPKGYKVAGKTGTAQIAVEGNYDEEKTLASFVGFAPPSNPKMVMLVMLREPQSSPWASETAAPLWFDIARDLFPHLGIKPGD